ncbi:MAG: ABC transporter ATP-binding protein [Pseudomonadota bacterium]
MIIIDEVIKRYGADTIIDGLSLTLPAGGVTALIGPNGAGKSTLLSMIGRLLPFEAGTITVDGLDVTKAPGDRLAKCLAVLRQENHIVARLTVRELVGYGRYPHCKGRPTAEDRDHVDRALSYLDLTGLADRFLDQLSGGQRQRAFVAMVLAQDTDYLLLDEPLNNLDIKHAASMMGLLRRCADDLGRTVIVVLHDINFASWHADRIVALRDGRLVHQGPPEALIRPDTLAEIYDTPIEVRQIDGRQIALHYA